MWLVVNWGSEFFDEMLLVLMVMPVVAVGGLARLLWLGAKRARILAESATAVSLAKSLLHSTKILGMYAYGIIIVNYWYVVWLVNDGGLSEFYAILSSSFVRPGRALVSFFFSSQPVTA